MKKLIIISLSLLFNSYSFAQPFSMYIAAKPISCNSYTYEIEVYKYGYPVSNLLMPMILSFGDGTVDEISLDNYSFFDDNNGRAITIYKRVHTFPGAGIYDISLRFFNRSHDIRNMAHSINTPFYIESRIIIDPFLGCNSTPVLENMTYLIKKGTNYMQDFSFTDIENDSLSFCFATPMQDDSIPVIDYQIPMEYELELNNPISRISLDPINGSMFLNAKNLEYTQSAVLQVNEWRKVNGEYYQISRTNLDFVIYYIETDNNTPEISQITDTAIIIGKEFRHLIVATDPDNDSIQLNSYGDLFQFFDIVHNEISGYNPGPLEKSISFSPVSENVRPLPYKAIFSVNDKSLDNNMSMYIWVADKAHIPDPVQYFTARESGPGIIKLDWIDIDDELGYIIERSDKFFPEYQRLVVLPAESISYYDSSVVAGNTYHYRIKAVGTSMSAFNTAEVSTTDVITSLYEIEKKRKLKIYPNPSNGSFSINYSAEKLIVDIHAISGKIIWSKEIDNQFQNSKNINISTGLSMGIYIMNIYSDNTTYIEKIMIN